MEKICPKCKNTFECKAEDIANCHCTSIVLSAETSKQLAKYAGCLCNLCLIELQAKAENKKAD